VGRSRGLSVDKLMGALLARPPPPTPSPERRGLFRGRQRPWGKHDAGPVGNGNEAGDAGETGDRIATTLPELALELGLASVEEREEFAAVEDEIADQFFPGVAVHLLGDDAEIEADIDQEGADRAVADVGSDLLRGGEAGEGLEWSARLAVGCGAGLARGGRAEVPRSKVAASGGAAEEPGFERGGAEQTTVDAGEDQGDIAGAEDAGDEGEAGEGFRVVGVLLEEVGEVPAVGDERADEAEELADARGHGPIGGIGVEEIGRGGEGVGHGWNRSTE